MHVKQRVPGDSCATLTKKSLIKNYQLGEAKITVLHIVHIRVFAGILQYSPCGKNVEYACQPMYMLLERLHPTSRTPKMLDEMLDKTLPLKRAVDVSIKVAKALHLLHHCCQDCLGLRI